MWRRADAGMSVCHEASLDSLIRKCKAGDCNGLTEYEKVLGAEHHRAHGPLPHMKPCRLSAWAEELVIGWSLCWVGSRGCGVE